MVVIKRLALVVALFSVFAVNEAFSVNFNLYKKVDGVWKLKSTNRGVSTKIAAQLEQELARTLVTAEQRNAGELNRIEETHPGFIDRCNEIKAMLMSKLEMVAEFRRAHWYNRLFIDSITTCIAVNLAIVCFFGGTVAVSSSLFGCAGWAVARAVLSTALVHAIHTSVVSVCRNLNISHTA